MVTHAHAHVHTHTHIYFGKLQEHEMELKRLAIDEELEKKSKSPTLKFKESDSGGGMSLIVKNFKRFLRHENKQKEELEKDEEKAIFVATCYTCGKEGNIMPNYPLAKKENQKKSMKLQKKGEKAYVIWEDNDMESSYDEKEANICLMESR